MDDHPKLENLGLELGRGAVVGDENLGVVVDTVGTPAVSLGLHLCKAGWAEFQQPEGTAFGWHLSCLAPAG